MKLHDLNKKGTIILSHYRAGGSQLRTTIVNVLKHEYKINCDDLKELDFDIDTLDFKKTLEKKLSHKNYGVLLLNNPIAIAWLHQRGYFDTLINDYHFISLSRKDKVKSMLSLPLWVELIKRDLYHSGDDNVAENMLKFHNDLLETPIRWQEIHLGYFTIYENGEKPIYQLNHTIRHLLDEFHRVDSLSKQLKISILYYEDFEFNKKYLTQFFKNTNTLQSRINNIYKKIPYVSDDYRIYYDDIVKETLKVWGL